VRSIEDRFWEKVNKLGAIVSVELGPCWEWTACLSKDGYGRFRVSSTRSSVEAYIVALELDGIEIPSGYQPDHLCKNNKCVRTSHIEIVTAAENNARGHRKLNKNQVLDIRSKFDNGVRKAQLAREYGVAFMTITFIVRRETWSDL